MSTLLLFSTNYSFATNLEIIPLAKDPDTNSEKAQCIAWEKITIKVNGKEIDCSKWTVWDRQNMIAEAFDKKRDTGWSFAIGAFTWNTVLEYVVYIIRFLSQLGIVVGVVMIMMAGYKYASGVFGFDKAPSTEMIKNAIIWVLIITFSYAIIRALSAAFL